MAGARQHNLPPEYINGVIDSTKTAKTQQSSTEDSERALEVLKRAGYDKVLQLCREQSDMLS